MRLMEPFASFTSKNHILYHLLEKLQWFGSPAFYATWLDETLNRDLKSCCRFVSQGNFESAVLLRMCDILEPAAKRRRMR